MPIDDDEMKAISLTDVAHKIAYLAVQGTPHRVTVSEWEGKTVTLVATESTTWCYDDAGDWLWDKELPRGE